MVKVTDNNLYIDKYVDIDTNSEHNLLIYQYSFDGQQGFNIVMGEVSGDTDKLIMFFSQIINFQLNHRLYLFLCDIIKKAKETGLLNNIKLTDTGYKLLISNDIYKCLNNNLNQVIIDPLTKYFSSIAPTQTFKPIEYYEEINNQKELGIKTLKKAINY